MTERARYTVVFEIDKPPATLGSEFRTPYEITQRVNMEGHSDDFYGALGFSWVKDRSAVIEEVTMELVKPLRDRVLDELRGLDGGEEGHIEADDLLLDFVRSVDPELADAYEGVQPKWYA